MRPRRGGRGRAASASLLGILFLNTVPLWRPMTRGVITEGWADILWAANLSLSLNLVGNLLLLFYDPRWLRSWLKAAFPAAGLLSLVVFLIVFPLDFSGTAGGWLNVLVRAALGIAAAAVTIAAAFEVTRNLVGAAWRGPDR